MLRGRCRLPRTQLLKHLTGPDKPVQSIEEKPPAEKRLEVLASHYNDTFSVHKATHQERNQLFFYLLIWFSLFLLNIKNSSLIQEVIKWLLKSQDASVFDSLIPYSTAVLWVVLVGIAIRYFQLCLLVERQYDYLYLIEEELNSYYQPDSNAFTREGRAYLKDYPLFSNWMCFVYTFLFPILIMVACLFRIPIDFNRFGFNYVGITCMISYLVIEVSCFSYFGRIRKIFCQTIENHWLIAVLVQAGFFSVLFYLAVRYLPIS